jgi:Fanconi anemia group J protein
MSVFPGFEVHFPHQPYGVQKVFMNQVLRAIDHQENALLEAPTGSGKTLSLLCAALAWQSAQKTKAAQASVALAAALAEAEAQRVASIAAKDGTSSPSSPASLDGKSAQGVPSTDPAGMVSAAPQPLEAEEITVPKIYYATRTHSQIAQVGIHLCCSCCKGNVYEAEIAR